MRLRLEGDSDQLRGIPPAAALHHAASSGCLRAVAIENALYFLLSV